MSFTAWLAVAIFVGAYALIVSEKIHRTIVALAGAILMILLGILSQEQAISHIDFNTLGLLIGMMIMVAITSETGLFNYLSIWAAKKTRGEPIYLLVVMALLTAFCSAFLDNVTTVLLTVPVTFSITEKLGVSPKPFLIAQILASNIGGAATLIGDPPNIMIGSANKDLTFFSFMSNLSGICFLILLVTLAIIVLIYHRKLKTTNELKEKVTNLVLNTQITRPKLLKKCLITLSLTILLFLFHGQLHVETGTAALAGATLLLAITMPEKSELLAKIFGKIEWLAIFFFAGLFVLVGALVETGVIELLARQAMDVTQGDLTKASMVILWMSAIASAFIDNIPLVATLIPLIQDMGTMGMTNLEPLWWALSLGACLGGNGTLVGASANVVVAGMAVRHGYKISFVRYLLIAFPLMLLSIAIASIYLYLRYLT